MNRHRPVIRLHRVPGSQGHYVAVFASEFLGATFAVTFQETITGAVALHTFAEMIRKQYGPSVEIILPRQLSLQEGSPVKDLLSQLRQPLFVNESS